MKVLSKLNSLDNVNDGDTRKLITKTSGSGTGNVVSSINVSGDTISYTKGVNALTSHQNTFSTVKVGNTNVAADKAGDTLELAAGSNITLTPDAINDKVTIAATDTKNTAGSTDTSSKIFLIGATSQAANSQTYSDNEVFATNGVLQAKEYSINNGAKIVYNSTDKTIEFKFI